MKEKKVYIANMFRKLVLKRVLLALLLLILSLGTNLNAATFQSSKLPVTVCIDDPSLPITKSRLFTFFNLTLPDAIVSTAASFQVSLLACFCFILLSFFLFYSALRVLEVKPLFIYSYRRILFLSLILINAP